VPCHPSHKTRFSFDASTFDVICELCGATDEVPGGWGLLAEPCAANREYQEQKAEKETGSNT
jgi:hypothetical protein